MGFRAAVCAHYTLSAVGTEGLGLGFINQACPTHSIPFGFPFPFFIFLSLAVLGVELLALPSLGRNIELQLQPPYELLPTP